MQSIYISNIQVFNILIKMSKWINEDLKKQFESQLQFVHRQIDDLMDRRSEKTDKEDKESVDDSLEQLWEYGIRLNCVLKCKNPPSLYIDFNNVRLASFCATITKAFQTPSIANMFAKNEQNALREKFKEIQSDMKSCKLNLLEGKRQKLEVLSALKCLGCELTDEDQMFIRGEIRIIHSITPF